MLGEWIIDIIKEWVELQGYATEDWVEAKNYLTDGYVNRGDPNFFDFELPFFIQDFNWHVMGLSGLTPPGITAVHLRVTLRANTVSKDIHLRKMGNVNDANNASVRTQVANIVTYHDKTVSVDSARRIQYKVSAAGINILRVSIAGWFY